MRSLTAMILAALLVTSAAQALEVDHNNELKNDLTCMSKDVFDAGFLVLGDLTPENKLNMRIETVNNWTGNTVEYSQHSEIMNMSEDGFCASVVVNSTSMPTTVVVISEESSLEKLNGAEVPRFTELNCVVSPKMHKFFNLRTLSIINNY